MSGFTKLALKNIFRNKRRTIITLSIISFGMISLFFTYGFISFTFEGLRESTIRQGIGHLQIFHEEFGEKVEEKALEYAIENPDSIINELLYEDDARFAMKRIDFNGLISNGDKSEIFIGRGIQPKLEEKLSSVFVKIVEGKVLSQNMDGEPQIIVGKDLAKNLNAKIGDYLTVLTSTTYGAQNAIDLKLVGTFKTGVPEMDKRLINIDIDAAQMLIDTKKVSKVVVVLKDSEKTLRNFEKFKKMFPNYKIKTWEDLAPFYKAVVNLYNSAFGLLSFIIAFIVILAISNTMVMSITERTKEIGTFLAIGTSQKSLLKNFIVEGLSIGIIGSVFSVILGFLVIFIVNNLGLMMPPPPGSTEGYPIFINILPVVWLKISLGMILISIISTILPAYKASRMNIVDSLGHI
jgi:putative ABC transport system permease protein